MHFSFRISRSVYVALILAIILPVSYLSIGAATPGLIELFTTLETNTPPAVTQSETSSETAPFSTKHDPVQIAHGNSIQEPLDKAAAAATSGCVVKVSIQPNFLSVGPGGEVAYNILIENHGNISCQNVSSTVYYGNNQIFSAALPMPSASNYYWRVGTLAPTAQYSMKLYTKNVVGNENEEMATEICATADNGQDSCISTIVKIGAQELVSTGQQQMLTQKTSVVTSAIPLATQLVNQEYGVWVWESPIQMTSAKSEEMLRNAESNGFNVVYITIDDYLEISSLSEGTVKKTKKDAYFAALSRIIASAKSKGIAIDVEGGWRDWAITKNRWKGYALIDFVKEYNTKYPQAKIRGLQYDVEPYLLASYENNKAGALKPFVEFIDESAKRMQSVDAKFTIVIPHFYDSAQKWTPAITYNGVTKYTFTHLLDVLEKKKGSAIIIMAYRNTFAGNDGTEQLSKAEIQEASSGSYSTSIIVAQEVGNVEPGYVTFFGLSKSELLVNVNLIQTGFKSYLRFGGVAIHYLDPYLQLR